MIQKLFNVLLFLFLAVFMSYTRFILSCDFQYYLTTHVWIKHVFLFMFIFFTISYQINADYKNETQLHLFLGYVFIVTTIVYISFILMTKLSLPFLAFSIFLLCTHFVLSDFLEQVENEQRKKKITYGLLVVQVLFGLNVFMGIVYMLTTQWNSDKTFKSLFLEQCVNN